MFSDWSILVQSFVYRDFYCNFRHERHCLLLLSHDSLHQQIGMRCPQQENPVAMMLCNDHRNQRSRKSTKSANLCEQCLADGGHVTSSNGRRAWRQSFIIFFSVCFFLLFLVEITHTIICKRLKSSACILPQPTTTISSIGWRMEWVKATGSKGGNFTLLEGKPGFDRQRQRALSTHK